MSATARRLDPVRLAKRVLRRARPRPPAEAVRSRACDAPSRNMYFAATGAVAPCWIQLGRTGDVWSTERSLLDIYRGPAFQHLREELAAHRYPGACTRCGDEVAAGVQPLARVYDGDASPLDVPTTLELELSNRCNYECTMCQGDLSSLIRKNREKRPPLVSPYDDSFVEQVAEVLPHLDHIRFSGGEPFLHPIVHRIIDRILEQRPDLWFTVSTNGSVMTPKVKKLLERTAVEINVSFDSLQAERYEAIRIHSDFEKLMTHLEAYQDHAHNDGGRLSINTNPMRPNWDEMPDFVRWCNERGLYLSFNTVIHPDHMTLKTLPADELRRVHETLAAVEDHGEGPDDAVLAHNDGAYRDMVHTIAGWVDEAEQRERPVPVSLGAPQG